MVAFWRDEKVLHSIVVNIPHSVKILKTIKSYTVLKLFNYLNYF